MKTSRFFLCCMATLGMASCASNSPAQTSRVCSMEVTYVYDSFHETARKDLVEQFLVPNNIKDTRDYITYPERLAPFDEEHKPVGSPVDDWNDEFLYVFTYAIVDDAHILGYNFWRLGDLGGFGDIPYRYPLNYDTEFIFPTKKTYPSVWKDGVVYPTLIQAYEAGVIPDYVLTEGFWDTVERPPVWERIKYHCSTVFVSSER